MIRVGIIDDHQIVIKGLAKIISEYPATEVVFQSTTGSDVVNRPLLDGIDVLLLDIEMPEPDGVDLANAILKIAPQQKILILTMYKDVALATKLKEMGVKGFLSKDADEEELLQVIENISNGTTHFDILKADSSDRYFHSAAYYYEKAKALSDREREILLHIVEGYNNQQIGKKLHISHRTVDTHRTHIMKKMDASNVASLVRIALKSGIVV